MQVRTSYKVEKVIVTGFLLVILVGALLLWFSNNIVYGMSLSATDSLFLATSAVCVTGLSTISIATDMGRATQVILLILIQIGGLGFMTGMMLITMAVGRRIGIKSRIFFLGGLGVEGVQGAVKLLMTVIRYTLFFESLGAVIFFIGFMLHGDGIATSLYYAVFHSISSFCNAGFSPIVNGLQPFSRSIIVPATAMLLIVLGGLGFPVFAECWSHFATKKRISPYAKLVISITVTLIAFGTGMILISDWNTAFKGMPVWAKVWNALFASVTTRTAGYDTVAPGAFSHLGQVIMIFLMVIGASPASTGGGIKTTTIAVLAISVWNELQGREESTFMHRKIPAASERRALALTVVYVLTFFYAAVLLTFLEDMPFSAIIFETASAIGTVGLTVGITQDFSIPGKFVLIALMFWGRVGILSFFASVIASEKGPEIKYPETHIPI